MSGCHPIFRRAVWAMKFLSTSKRDTQKVLLAKKCFHIGPCCVLEGRDRLVHKKLIKSANMYLDFLNSIAIRQTLLLGRVSKKGKVDLGSSYGARSFTGRTGGKKRRGDGLRGGRAQKLIKGKKGPV